MKAPSVLQIDHVEMFVPNREEAAEWYRRVLGLEIVAEYRFWAGPGGPLMITTREGGTKLALFEGEPPSARRTQGFHRVAFRIDGEVFLDYLDRLDALGLVDRDGTRLTPEKIFDHEKSFSMYFVDPYGHNLEITTYDHEMVRSRLRTTNRGGVV